MVLMVYDHHYHRLDQLRSQLFSIVHPVQNLVSRSIQMVTTCQDHWSTHQDLVKENARLGEIELIQNARLQKLLALESENARLRALLQSSSQIGEDLLVAEIIQVDSD